MANPNHLYQQLLLNRLNMIDSQVPNICAIQSCVNSDFYSRIYMKSYLSMAAGVHDPRLGPLVENSLARSGAMPSIFADAIKNSPVANQSRNGVGLLQRVVCVGTPRASSSPSPSPVSSPVERENNKIPKLATSEEDKSIDISDSKNSSKILYIDQVCEFDVLCGRGGRSNHHSGNKRYRQIVNKMKLKYKSTEAKTAKTDLSRAIVDYICNYGGRFLKKEGSSGKYYLLTRAEARKKTSQALRESKERKWMYKN